MKDTEPKCKQPTYDKTFLKSRERLNKTMMTVIMDLLRDLPPERFMKICYTSGGLRQFVLENEPRIKRLTKKEGKRASV